MDKTLNKLKGLIEGRGYKETADISGVSLRFIYRIMNEGASPSITVTEKILDALDYDLEIKGRK